MLLSPHSSRRLSIVLLTLCLAGVLSADARKFSRPHGTKPDWMKCKDKILRSNKDPARFLIRLDGERTNDTSEAIGTDYETCKAYCGTEANSFEWDTFSQQLAGWLLPFLALTAQLPFQSDGTWHNLMSLFLTVGSPPLGMYSLTLTMLNSRYVKRRLDESFSRGCRDPHRQLMLDDLRSRMFHALRFSQQDPFALGDLGAYDLGWDTNMKTEVERRWWKALHETLHAKCRSFTASVATQSALTVVTFSFTWVEALGSTKINPGATVQGLAISLCWSWVGVLVLGWLFAGTSLSRDNISVAIEQANQAHPDALPRLAPFKRRRGCAYVALTRRVAGDTERPGPLYNYARVFTWTHMADQVVDAVRQHILEPQSAIVSQLQQPNQRPGQQQPSHPFPTLSPSSSSSSPSPSSFTARSRIHQTPLVVGSASVTNAGSVWRDSLEDGEALKSWKRRVYRRIAWAALSAIILNLSTVMSAFWLYFLTPPVGLGCRSGGVLIYLVCSYVIWIAMVSSAWISDRRLVQETSQHKRHGQQQQHQQQSIIRRYSLGVVAVLLRTFGKTLAILNSAWIVLHSLLEFSRFFRRCYCKTNMGTGIWLFMKPIDIREVYGLGETWLGLSTLTGSMCTIYIVFIGLWTMKRLQRS